MGAAKSFLTNEQLGKRFTNSFELVNHAIELGKIMIRSGRPCRVPTPVQNTAYQLLLEVVAGKDSLDTTQAEAEAAASQIQVSTPKRENHYRNPILVSVKEQLAAEEEEDEEEADLAYEEGDLDIEIEGQDL
jgi:hypothetical protein